MYCCSCDEKQDPIETPEKIYIACTNYGAYGAPCIPDLLQKFLKSQTVQFSSFGFAPQLTEIFAPVFSLIADASIAATTLSN